MAIKPGTQTKLYKTASTTTRKAALYWSAKRDATPDDFILRWAFAYWRHDPRGASELMDRVLSPGFLRGAGTGYDVAATLAEQYVIAHNLDEEPNRMAKSK